MNPNISDRQFNFDTYASATDLHASTEKRDNRLTPAEEASKHAALSHSHIKASIESLKAGDEGAYEQHVDKGMEHQERARGLVESRDPLTSDNPHRDEILNSIMLGRYP